ncbi:hypothetical protein KGF54_000315 [Candida jiufengensis]|uniref:uncharacterized protein n=1 Tax=Candida jiufengensis TaxID=497108 RepID=UPI0022247011|nr:uncharacterized protein KGF54_000315 [Candida jiufengensis]KAI5956698.1 hypothetical protein KGF54_000315 [Candida jiufengensis]
MSHDSVSTNENTNLKIDEDDENEKLRNRYTIEDETQRKRKEKLQAWRKKKQQAQQFPKNVPSSNLQQTSTISHQLSKDKTAISISKEASTVRPFRRKRIEFEGEENHSNLRKKPKFEVPKTENNVLIKDTSKTVDELDVFIIQLNNNNSKQTLIEKEEVQIYSVSEEDEKEEDLQNRIDSKLAKLGNTKILKEIDSSKINYKPFKKNFYQVPFEMSLMSHEEIELLRLELDNIRVKGDKIPIPFTKWSQLILPSNMIIVINELNFTKPSPIQSQSIPNALSGRDLIAVAKIGSGKTSFYVLPLMRHINAANTGPSALILCPTRELALQIEQEVLNFFQKSGLKNCLLLWWF